MRILFQNEWCVFAATTVEDGDFGKPFHLVGETTEAFATREQEWFARLRLCLESSGLKSSSIHLARLRHGDDIAYVDRDQDSSYEGVDGLVTLETGRALVVTGGDCAPVFACDLSTKAIGIVHSGRPGTELNIAGKLVKEIAERTKRDPSEFEMWIGPAICGQHYQVEKGKAELFGDVPHAVQRLVDDDADHVHLDLNVVLQSELEGVGVASKNIHLETNECTYEHRDRWFSFRRDMHDGLGLERPRVQAFIAMRLR